jgi:hypothetical protein
VSLIGWPVELIKGIQNIRRKFEVAAEHIGNKPKIKREYDQASF